MSVEISEDAALGGSLRLRQPRRGHRVGHDAILLAAACPARPGERVVDLGAGIGAAGLAVAARVSGTMVTLVEIDAELAALSLANAQLNGLAERVNAVVLDVTAPAREFAAAGLRPESAARVLMNPPFNDPLRARPSPDRRRRLAYSMANATAWVAAATRLLRPRGTLTLIWRADGLGEILRALDGALGAVRVLPVHGKPGAPAIRVLLEATKASRAPLSLLPAFLLTDGAGLPTMQAQAVLQGGASLPLAQDGRQTTQDG
jgi:tRNA1(Val) A37 N6-methylase TrmN6